MSYYPPHGYDPARQPYYAPPPAGYPGSPNGYGPPHSPTGPPPRPHTTAPFPTSSPYGPPPPGQALYYGIPPPGQEPGPAPGPTASALAPAQAASATADGAFSNMSPEQLQGMIDTLKNMKEAKSSPAPAPAVLPPRLNTSVAPGPAAPQSARPISQNYQYPPYGYYGRPSSHSGEVSPPPSAPAYAPGPPPPPKAPGPMPGSFYAEAPPAPPPPSKTPAPAPAPAPAALAPARRPDNARKHSEQASERSFSSDSQDMARAWEQWGGPLVEVAPGREPRPKPKLVALFRGIAAYMVSTTPGLCVWQSAC